MKKSDRIRDLVRDLSVSPREAESPEPAEGAEQRRKLEALKALDARYLGYFTCFNTARYYEAHDVLEDLWLSEPSANSDFFKGLIQFAGAFVHLQKQRARPDHPKDGRRLAPAARLFALADRNLAPFGPHHLGLDVTAVLALGSAHSSGIIASDFTLNPWHPDRAPQLTLR